MTKYLDFIFVCACVIVGVYNQRVKLLSKRLVRNGISPRWLRILAGGNLAYPQDTIDRARVFFWKGI